MDLSYDHKPSRADERARILAAGGTVITNRLYGVLGVSRSFGDLRFKNTTVRARSTGPHRTTLHPHRPSGRSARPSSSVRLAGLPLSRP